MKQNRFFHKITGILLCFVIAVACLSVTAFARTPIDVDQKAILTVEYPCQGASLQLYRVADVSMYGEYSLSEDFVSYPVSLEQADQDGWRALASTLSGYVSRDQIAPVQVGTTGANGKIVFADLPVGMYLVVGERCVSGDYRYTSEPFLVALPELDSSENWIYDVSALPKYVRETIHDTVNLEAIKIWKNLDNLEKRPDSVEIQLLRNGKIFDTVMLSEQNDWKYKWEKLDDRYTWQIVENKVPDGYTVTVQVDGNRFIVTNSLKGPEDPQTPPNLPQTGVLWWPVGVLAVSGMTMLLLGWIRRKH